VTGAAKRIGACIAAGLAKSGVNVILHYNGSEEEVEALGARLSQGGTQVWTVQGDFSEPDSVEALWGEALGATGSIDFLINNASIYPEGRLQGTSMEELQRNLNVNALAPFVLGRLFAAQDREGAIVNLLDTMVTDYDRRHFGYHVSKRMLLSLTSMMALDFAPKVRVNGIAPGLVLPPEGQDETYLQRLASSNPLGAYGDVADVTQATRFLLRSSFVTGQIIYVDGGRHLKGKVYG
jgi:NAD(P)-dependent dehydrogenase (short-subunit alcohol dehydrogenase family)